MSTYVMGSYGDRYVVIRVNSSGPSYHVVAVCTDEGQATAIATALNS